MFDLNKLKTLDEPTTRDKAIDHLMNYWDEEFSSGRFDEFGPFVEALDLSMYSAEVVVCINTIGWWIKEKFKFKAFTERVIATYKERGFPEERIRKLVVGIGVES